MSLLNYRMRIYKILFFLLMVFFVSCGKKTPPGILSHKQMTALLVDMHIVDGSLFTVQPYPDSLYKYSAAKYQYVFKQHQTDSIQFKNSFKYYTNKPDELLDIYEEVVPIIKTKNDSVVKYKIKFDSLERIKQTKINQMLAKRAADSLKRIKKVKADSLKKKAKAVKPAQAQTL